MGGSHPLDGTEGRGEVTPDRCAASGTTVGDSHPSGLSGAAAWKSSSGTLGASTGADGEGRNNNQPCGR